MAPRLLLLGALAAALVGWGCARPGSSPDASTDTDTPVLLWASSGVQANRTVLVWGAELGGVRNATVGCPPSTTTTTTAPNDGQRNCLQEPTAPVVVDTLDGSVSSFKAVIPPTAPVCPGGVWSLCVAPTACILINGPDLFWLRGDSGLTSASPGGWVRLFGRGMRAPGGGSDGGPSVQLQLQAAGRDGAPRVISAVPNSTAHAALFNVPADLAEGTYKLAAAVPSGGAVVPVGSIAVQRTAPPPSLVISINSTDALAAALAKCRDSGGGTVVLARGGYRMAGSIDLPPNTTLRGVSTEHTALYWNTNGLDTVPPYLVGGNASFAVTDLSIFVTSRYHDIIRDGGRELPNQGFVKSNGVAIRRIRIRANCFFRLTERNEERRGLFANFTYEQVGSAVKLSGTNFVVEDCDIYASMYGIFLEYAEVGLVQRNAVWYGGTGYMIDSSSNIVLEQCNFTGINLFARGNAGGATYGGPAASYLAFLNNRVEFVLGGDMELMTLDGGHSVFVGQLQSISPDGLDFTMPQDPYYPQWCSSPGHCQLVHTQWNGSAVYVLSGKGAGQFQTVAAGGIKYNRTWRLAEPFQVPLDTTTSFVSVFEKRVCNIFADSVFADGGPLQLYGGAWQAVVANNVMYRTDGFVVEGLNHEGAPGHPSYLPSWFVELTGNRIEEGASYSLYPAVGGFSTSGYYNASPAAPYHGPMVSALVYRDNFCDNCRFSISGAVGDVLLEGNVMENSDSGLVVSGNQTARIFLRGNTNL